MRKRSLRAPRDNLPDTRRHAAHVAKHTALPEGAHAMPVKRVANDENGATLKGTTTLAALRWPGIGASCARPCASDGKIFAEALFGTVKYRTECPVRRRAGVEATGEWAVGFVRWYTDEHWHSGTGYVTPAPRYGGPDHLVLTTRHSLYQQVRQHDTARWRREIRNWTPVAAVASQPGALLQWNR